MWARNNSEEMLDHLRQFTTKLAKDIAHETNEHSHRSGVSKNKMAELTKLLARCYFKQGEWQVKLKDDWSSVRRLHRIQNPSGSDFASQRNIQDILHSYFLATVYDPTWCKAWHTWALANCEVIGYLDQLDGRGPDVPPDALAVHVVQAIDGRLFDLLT